MNAIAADGVWQRQIAARPGINRRTVRRLLEADGAPSYRRAPVALKLDRSERILERVLAEWPKIRAPRMTQILRARI